MNKLKINAKKRHFAPMNRKVNIVLTEELFYP